jgi:hypothetical protein
VQELLRILDRDSIGALALVVATAFLALRVIDARGSQGARLAAGAAMIAYAVHRCRVKLPTTAEQLQEGLLRTLVVAALAYAAARFALYFLILLYSSTLGVIVADLRERLKALGEEGRRAMEERRKAESERLRREQTSPPSPEPPPPRPREELAAHAKQRYDETLRLLAAAQLDEAELKAGRDKAKQDYLRELDSIVKAPAEENAP